MDAGGIGAVDGDMQLMIAVLIGLDLNGVVGAVLELEIDLIAPHSGVSADDRHIAAVECVLGAFHGFQVGLQGDPVNGGGQLADAASGGVNALSVLIGAGVSVAAGLGVGTGQGVVGEHLAGQQDGAIDPAGG